MDLCAKIGIARVDRSLFIATKNYTTLPLSDSESHNSYICGVRWFMLPDKYHTAMTYVTGLATDRTNNT